MSPIGRTRGGRTRRRRNRAVESGRPRLRVAAMRRVGIAAAALVPVLVACAHPGVSDARRPGGALSPSSAPTHSTGPGRSHSGQQPVIQPGPLTPALRGVTSCGIPYLFWISARWVESGSCAGLIPSTPVTASTSVGSAFLVRVAHGSDGVLGFPIPRPGRPIVVVADRHRYWVTYRATQVGTVNLVGRTRFCASHDPQEATCSFLRLHVTAH